MTKRAGIAARLVILVTKRTVVTKRVPTSVLHCVLIEVPNILTVSVAFISAGKKRMALTARMLDRWAWAA